VQTRTKKGEKVLQLLREKVKVSRFVIETFLEEHVCQWFSGKQLIEELSLNPKNVYKDLRIIGRLEGFETQICDTRIVGKKFANCYKLVTFYRYKKV